MEEESKFAGSQLDKHQTMFYSYKDNYLTYRSSSNPDI